MFFCPNCNNTFDITRSIPEISTQIGGTTPSVVLSSSDIIEKIFHNNITVQDLSGIVINDFIKTSDYKNLSNEKKELVFNVIQDLLPKNKKKIMDNVSNAVSDNNNSAFFLCTNCGHVRKIENRTLIFSRTAETIMQSYDTCDYADLIHSNILPHTRNYVCSNDTCQSHSDMSKKDAIFFRVGNGYSIKYICLTCESIF